MAKIHGNDGFRLENGVRAATASLPRTLWESLYGVYSNVIDYLTL